MTKGVGGSPGFAVDAGSPPPVGENGHAPVLEALLAATAARHHHLCPRQVLGVRMGLYAGALLGIAVPQPAKRLLAIVETDGCASDGVAVATNCWVGRRTMRIEDLGKVAAVFVDCETGRAIRIAPHPHIRRLAVEYASEANGKWQAQLLGYQRMPASTLLRAEAVALLTTVEELVSRPGLKAVCDACAEEIINAREVRRGDQILCRSCTGPAYYRRVLADARSLQPS